MKIVKMVIKDYEGREHERITNYMRCLNCSLWIMGDKERIEYCVLCIKGALGEGYFRLKKKGAR